MHLPHATATFFELAIALSALSVRNLDGIERLDTVQRQSKKVLLTKISRLKYELDLNGIKNKLTCRRSWLRFFSLLALLSSVIGLIMFGYGAFDLTDQSHFNFSFSFFVMSAFIAACSDTEKIDHFNKPENQATKMLLEITGDE